MKKLVLLLFVALISIQISAQEFHFIPRIGFNLANTYPESFADMRPGVNVGVAGENPLFQIVCTGTGSLLFHAGISV